MSDLDYQIKCDIELSRQPGITSDEYELIRKKNQLTLLIISDTHGQIGSAQQALDLVPETDLILHLGDHASDLGRLRELLGKPILAVRGNCDGFGRKLPPEILELNLAGCRIVMTHGHNRSFDVKDDFFKIRQYASTSGNYPDLLLFGHTHFYHDEIVRGSKSQTRLLNPGSCSYTISAISINLTDGNIDDVTRLISSS